jgi:phosphoglycolate phosphatase
LGRHADGFRRRHRRLHPGGQSRHAVAGALARGCQSCHRAGAARSAGNAVSVAAGSLHPELANHYRRHFLSQDAEIPLFDGARELIAELHAGGHLLAVATGKARRGLDRAFEHSGLAPFFHASRTADETFSKPHPMMLEQLLDELMVPPERALMIGDTSHDLDMARNAGMASLAAGFGAHPPESLAAYDPLAVCSSFAELASWLRCNA